ncbi:MAG: GNAT family N-acetyltransferase [Chloroflexota bacterium]|nr:GNAT family N-acetyltransferase [Chloroflexota bacterium]
MGAPRCRLFARGPDAVLHGAQALGLGAGDEVLVPAYHDGWEVEALIAAGVVPRFYDCDERLEPDEARLTELLSARTRALHLIHYLGFPQNAARWREWCDRQGLLLIEDATRSWLSWSDPGPVGSLGDLQAFCFYESLALPSGAALVSSTPPEPQMPGARLGLIEAGDARVARPEAGALITVPWLLARLCDRGVAGRRRANYQALLDALGDDVPAPFETLPAGASPLVFPFDAVDKGALLKRLAAHGVLGLNLWPIPHPSLPATGFPDAERRRRSTVGLPVHQDLRPRDLERIIAATGRSSRPRPELRLERLPGLDANAESWELLAERADNIFATREWLSLWWRHFGLGEPQVLGCRRESGELAAILPLYASRVGPVRTLRFLGHGVSDQLGPICELRDRSLVARALRRALEEGVLGGWDVLLGEQFPSGHGWSALLGGTVIRDEASPVLRARGRTFDDILSSRSANFRQQVGRRERKLRREHGLVFRLTTDHDRLQDDLTTLFELHAARWSDAESSAFSPERQAFHREWVPLALDRGWLRLWVAEADGRPVAALYGFRFAGSELYYQSGRDPAYSRQAVGFALLAHAIRTALDEGAAEYRLLRGDEPYKHRFADHDPGLETFIAARGAASRTAVNLAAAVAGRDSGRRLLARIARSVKP